MKNNISIFQNTKAGYPSKSPFHPFSQYPEYPFQEVDAEKENHVYHAVRESFLLLGFDQENYGKKDWNPLGHLIKPGQKVIIKPNMVISEHPLGKEGIIASVANGSIIRAVIDYVFIALKGEGKITICDSPIKEVDFVKLVKILSLDDIIQFYRDNTNIEIETLDLRDIIAVRNSNNVITSSIRTEGDPSGYSIVELDGKSFFSEIDNLNSVLRSTAVIYEDVMNEFHNSASHKYSIPNTILESDTIIMIPKLKTHHKSGITAALKNVIGVTNEKRTLPHHRYGPKNKGGDEYNEEVSIGKKTNSYLTDIFMRSSIGKYGFLFIMPILLFFYKLLFKPFLKKSEDIYTQGDWYGNDTIWRTTLDLNHAIMYADKKGIINNNSQRKYFCILDCIIAGDGDGPLHPDPKQCGIIIAGINPVFVDILAARIMGFSYKKIPTLSKAIISKLFNEDLINVNDICIKSNKSNINNQTLDSLELNLDFMPSKGWKNHIEL